MRRYPTSAARDATIATLYVGFGEPQANDRIPPELAERICDALAPSIERGLEATRERRALRILEASGDAMLAWDRDERVADVNVAAERMLGASRANILGRPVDALLGETHPLPATGRRMVLTPVEGVPTTVAATVSIVQGDPLVTGIALLRDLSLVVRAEDQARFHLADLRAATEEHATLLDNAPILIFRIDPETGELRYLNRHAERLFGIGAERALSTKGWLAALHLDPEGRAAFREALERARAGTAASSYEARLGSGDMVPIVGKGTINPILASDAARERVTSVEGVFIDVTAERDARARLVQADRLATVGLLSAGIAHEINNPAAFMLLGLDALARQLEGPHVSLSPPADENVRQLVAELRDTGRRIVKIARDMRLFAAPPGVGRKVAVDVERTIDSALTLTRAQIVEKAEVVTHVEGDLPPVLLEEGRLGQVLVNLLVNAAQSLPGRSFGETRRDESVRVEAAARGKNVVIVVEDTGIGIPPAALERLFTPFFTTRANDAGAGLGLAISRAIVEDAAGSITAESPVVDGRGARFTVTLPAYAEEVLEDPGA